MIHPTKGNLFVKRLDSEEKKTAGGIIIPQTISERESHERVLIYAEVLAVGNKIMPLGFGNDNTIYEDTKSHFKVGDTVVFPRYEGWPLLANKSKDDNEFIVPERFIMAVVTKEK